MAELLLLEGDVELQDRIYHSSQVSPAPGAGAAAAAATVCRLCSGSGCGCCCRLCAECNRIVPLFLVQMILSGDAALSKSLRGEETINMDGVWAAIDCSQEAVVRLARRRKTPLLCFTVSSPLIPGFSAALRESLASDAEQRLTRGC